MKSGKLPLETTTKTISKKPTLSAITDFSKDSFKVPGKDYVIEPISKEDVTAFYEELMKSGKYSESRSSTKPKKIADGYYYSLVKPLNSTEIIVLINSTPVDLINKHTTILSLTPVDGKIIYRKTDSSQKVQGENKESLMMNGVELETDFDMDKTVGPFVCKNGGWFIFGEGNNYSGTKFLKNENIETSARGFNSIDSIICSDSFSSGKDFVLFGISYDEDKDTTPYVVASTKNQIKYIPKEFDLLNALNVKKSSYLVFNDGSWIILSIQKDYSSNDKNRYSLNSDGELKLRKSANIPGPQINSLTRGKSTIIDFFGEGVEIKVDYENYLQNDDHKKFILRNGNYLEDYGNGKYKAYPSFSQDGSSTRADITIDDTMVSVSFYKNDKIDTKTLHKGILKSLINILDTNFADAVPFTKIDLTKR